MTANGLHSKVLNEQHNILEIAKRGDLLSLVLYLQNHSLKKIYSQHDDQGHTAIHWACLQGHTSLVKCFIDAGAYMSIKSVNAIGKEPIHWACANGHIPIVSLLLQAGVDVNATDKNSTTPLLVACQFGHTMLANYLICKGAHIHIRDQHGNSPLHWAAFRGHEELCSMLIYFGLDANDIDKFGNNALHLSVISSSYWTFHAILNKANMDVTAVNSIGEAPMDLAVKYKNRYVQRALKIKLGTESPAERCRTLLMGPPGNSTFGVCFFLVNVIFWGYPMYVYHGIPTTWSSMKYSHCLFFLSNTVMWSTFFIAYYANPGFVLKNCSKYHNLVNEGSQLDDEIRILIESEGFGISSDQLKGRLNPVTRLCHTCHCIRPLRSKHCRKCDACVMNFDHHCPYIYNCVGINNRPYFFGYAASIFMNCILGSYISYATIQNLGWTWLFIFGFMEVCALTLLSITLFIFMTYYITQNLTTNEILNYKKYRYLKDPVTKKYKNPFHQGVWKNILSYFMCIPSPGTDENNVTDLYITHL